MRSAVRLFCFLIGMVFNRSRRSYYLFLNCLSYYLYNTPFSAWKTPRNHTCLWMSARPNRL